jgi:DNA-binding NarL/FixJ family response regulator
LQGNDEVQIVDYVFDGLEALRICAQQEINLILMVLTNDFEPINWIYVINAKFPKVKILIMIETITNEVLFSALRDGATGYILFTNNSEKIISAINLCLMGFFTTEQVCMKSLIPLMDAGKGERNRNDDQNRID